MDALLVAGFTALVLGALSLGALRVMVKQNTRAIQAMHARFDTLVIALAHHGTIDADAMAHLARHRADPSIDKEKRCDE